MKKGPHLVVYDSTGEERLSAIEFGIVKPGTSSQEIAVWVWNKIHFSDAPRATDVRLSAVAGNVWADGIIDTKCIKVRSNGVKDPDGVGIVDDEESEFTSVGGGLLESGDYHSIGDIPSNCARRLIIKVETPQDFTASGVPRFKLQAGCMSEEVKWLYASE